MMTFRTSILFACVIAAHEMHALEVSVQVSGASYCGQGMGIVSAMVTGGVPPYTYAWNIGATTASLVGMPAGTYSVIVTDAVGTTATGEGTVVDLPAYEWSTTLPLSHCNGMNPSVLFWAGTQGGLPPDPALGVQHGPGPYTFQATDYTTYYGEWPDGCNGYSYYAVGFDAPTGANVTVNYTDGAGCPGTFSYIVPSPIILPAVQVVDVTGSCSNGAIGTATVSIAAASDMQDFRVRLKSAAHEVLSDPCDMQAYGDAPALRTFTNLAPGTYWLVADMDVFGIRNDIQVPCADSSSFVIPDLGTTCGLVSGRVYIDNNANCGYNSGENNVPGTIIEITPGPFYTTTSLSGNYTVDLPFGTYQFVEQNTAVEQTCPLSVTVASATVPGRNIGCAGGMALDARVLMANGPARPGFELHYAIDVDNLTTATTGAVTLTVNVDPALLFVEVYPPATTIAGSTYTWNLSMTNAFQHREVHVHMRVPPDVGLIGSVLNTTATLTTANTDANLLNNTATSQQLITGSFDPNDKLVHTATGQEGTYVIGQDDWLDYTIRFQNTGTDTAFNVVVTDTLPATLDPATIEWGPSSHVCTRAIEGNGTLKFIYANILLPDSNRSEPESHGFVSFRIRPRQPVLPGTVFENIANIYFDFNPPVITEPSVLVAEFSTSVAEVADESFRVWPVPVGDVLNISSSMSLQIVRLIAMDGREVRRMAINGTRATIDVSFLSAGAYMIEGSHRNGRTKPTRFIKH